MITLKPVVLSHHKRPDGTYNVKIRVTFKRVSKYLPTTVVVSRSDLTKGSLKIKNAQINDKLNSLVKEMNSVISGLNPFTLDRMDCSDVVRYIQRSMASGGDNFRLDFIAYGMSKVEKMKRGTGLNYKVALNALSRYVGPRVLDISEINVRFLKGLEEFLVREPKQHRMPGAEESTDARGNKSKTSAVHSYMSCYKSLFNQAKSEFNDEDEGIIMIPRSPFSRYSIPKQRTSGRRNRSVGFIQKIISYDGPASRSERFTLDVYIISFALMGMNVADLFSCAPAKDGVIIYNRQKTRDRRDDMSEHHVRIEPCVARLMERYRDPEGRFMFDFHRRYSNANSMTGTLNHYLAQWAERTGEDKFTMYSARHSWATIARSSRCGVDKYTVNECLCHTDPSMKLADVYIEKDWSILWEANRKVLSLFEWPQY